MTGDYPEEEMYLKEHEILDKRISESELEWLTVKFSKRYPKAYNGQSGEEGKK